ncbi:hypothetical protein L6164_007813 [Bauhinia variegata]|uniref:Uncharacterized protein n=1 Tax=Bauhinia variegata TaxID=167791 RepID=A0ACB9PG53_BAUVA|nr:hypothetical protein L6164_007813 [Bauhinia variegata]
MRDHFVLSVGRLLTEPTLEAAIEDERRMQQAIPSSTNDDMIYVHKMDVENRSSQVKMVECRICHDEDEDANMETPCSCCGSLKYAHRRCVQRWCNEKGDTICEICRQPFEPGYTAPPPPFHYGGRPLNFRGNWDLHNHQFVAMVGGDGEFFDTDFEYSGPSTRALIYCRIVAILFMVLLILRHILPFILSDAGEYSLTLFMLLMLSTFGVLLPVFIVIKAYTAFQRRQHQDRHFSLTSSHEENNLGLPQSRVIRIW